MIYTDLDCRSVPIRSAHQHRRHTAHAASGRKPESTGAHEGRTQVARFTAIPLLALLLPATALAVGSQWRSDELLWSCTGVATTEVEASLGKIKCAAYISGILDSYRVISFQVPQARFICLPDQGISNDQAIRVVIKWLQEHPSRLQESARVSVLTALKYACPCSG